MRAQRRSGSCVTSTRPGAVPTGWHGRLVACRVRLGQVDADQLGVLDGRMERQPHSGCPPRRRRN